MKSIQRAQALTAKAHQNVLVAKQQRIGKRGAARTAAEQQVQIKLKVFEKARQRQQGLLTPQVAPQRPGPAAPRAQAFSRSMAQEVAAHAPPRQRAAAPASPTRPATGAAQASSPRGLRGLFAWLRKLFS